MGQLRDIRCRLVAADGAYQFRTIHEFSHNHVFVFTLGEPGKYVGGDVTSSDIAGHSRVRRYRFNRWEGKTAVFVEMI